MVAVFHSSAFRVSPFSRLYHSSFSTSSSACPGQRRAPLSKSPLFLALSIPGFHCKTHLSFPSLVSSHREIPRSHVSVKPDDEVELELLGKPSPVARSATLDEGDVSESQKAQVDEALAPFLKFFKAEDSLEQFEDEDEFEAVEERKEEVREPVKKVKVEYYDPKPGDFVVGVVVSGNENKLDVNVGADLLGTMLTKEVLPLYGEELSFLMCDMGRDAGDFMVPGKIAIVKDEEAFNRESVPGRPVVDVGTVLFAEVLGRTLSGRPLLSTRRLFRRVAWHRVRQIKQLNEPIEVKISEWNTGGLLTRVEGLRAFLPKAELVNKVNSFAALKENVGRCIYVLIDRIDEAKNDLIISEKEAWYMMNLRQGTLVDGTVRKIFPYGAQVRIGDSNRSGLLHISNITRGGIKSVSEVLSVGDKVKVLVVKSLFPGKISLSIADLESEPGLLLSDKERVFSEAEEMAKKYRQKFLSIPSNRELNALPSEELPFHDEATLYANWSWFKFSQDDEQQSQTGS